MGEEGGSLLTVAIENVEGKDLDRHGSRNYRNSRRSRRSRRCGRMKKGVPGPA